MERNKKNKNAGLVSKHSNDDLRWRALPIPIQPFVNKTTVSFSSFRNVTYPVSGPNVVTRDPRAIPTIGGIAPPGTGLRRCVTVKMTKVNTAVPNPSMKNA